MSTIFKILSLIDKKNYKLASNILESKIEKELNNDLFYFLLGKCYLALKNYQTAFSYLQKAALINPYGYFNNEIYSVVLNELAISGLVETNRPKFLLDTTEILGIHPRAFYPVADCMCLNNINDKIKPDYFLIPNWISPTHPVTEDLDNCPYPVISMIVDRILHSEEHLKGNLAYSDIIVAMEDYSEDIYKKLGFTNVMYVSGAGSLGYDPYWYPKMNYEKIYDVVFLGNLGKVNCPLVYKKRYKILKKLDSLKAKYNILIAETPSYQDYLKIMNQAKISLDVTIDSQALNYRMFQAIGLGSLCLAEDDNSMVTELYNDREDLVLYNYDNLEYLIDYYLKNDEEREKIANQGRIKTSDKYTHYHFFKMFLDKLATLEIQPSQKKKLSIKKSILYKGVTEHYKNLPHRAIDYFSQIEDKSIEVQNNLMVEKMIIYEEDKNADKEKISKEIDYYFEKNKNSIIILFNYISYLFYIKEEYEKSLSLIDNLIILIDKNFDNLQELGLYFISEKKEYDLLWYFKYRIGTFAFDYNFDSIEYYQEYLKILKEQCYRWKAIAFKNTSEQEAILYFRECIEFGSSHVFDFYDLAILEKNAGNLKKYNDLMSHCQEILPFEEKFFTN